METLYEYFPNGPTKISVGEINLNTRKALLVLCISNVLIRVNG